MIVKISIDVNHRRVPVLAPVRVRIILAKLFLYLICIQLYPLDFLIFYSIALRITFRFSCQNNLDKIIRRRTSGADGDELDFLIILSYLENHLSILAPK